jgi:hypothetical protein
MSVLLGSTQPNWLRKNKENFVGSGRWTTDSYTSYATSTNYRTATRAEVFSSSKMPQALDPLKIAIRESCDSELNPNSTPIIMGLDVTGSMGEYAELIAKDYLPDLIGRIIEESPIADPHMMFMGIDDAHCSHGGDLQVSQFEADIKILEQLRQIWLVGGGGGNNSESYDLPWYFAGTKTKIDSFDKRNQKGFLFTFGDEEAPYETLKSAELKRIFGSGQFGDTTPAESLALAKKMYHVFHVVIEQGSYYRSRPEKVRGSWTEILGNNVLFLKDANDLAEVVLGTLKIASGADMFEVISASKNPKALKYAFANAIASGD